MIFHKMSLDDLLEIKNILSSDFDDFWNFNVFKQELECDNSYFVVIKNFENAILGFAGYKKILDEADIMNIVIKKSERGKGLGYLVMNHLITIASESNIKKLNLEVNYLNIHAISLYKKCGFNQVGIRKKYYNNIRISS